MRDLQSLAVVLACVGAGAGCTPHWPTPRATMSTKPPAVLARNGSGVMVTIASDSPATLQIDDDGWKAVCDAPCIKAVPAGRTYRIVRLDWASSPDVPAGAYPEGLLVVNPFQMEGPDGATVHIDLGSTPPPHPQTSSGLNIVM
jgi:hypothetical protein